MEVGEGQFEVRFGLVAHQRFEIVAFAQQLLFVGGVGVHGVGFQYAFHAGRGACLVALRAQKGGFQVQGAEVVGVVGDGFVQPLERHRDVTLRHIELCQLEIACRVVVVVPDGAVERVHRRLGLALLLEDQA